eukprot:TRINITY_DN14894_c0_g2_i1.p1 TRINITY_DN14894_c0_g2~~TRINITY_DN14894_c0_g2_i1.p1  ORF type:complete len:520 (+),score=119.94 TRINITY_DN14894_c0_g2_i1:50-1609(+)
MGASFPGMAKHLRSTVVGGEQDKRPEEYSKTVQVEGATALSITDRTVKEHFESVGQVVDVQPYQHGEEPVVYHITFSSAKSIPMALQQNGTLMNGAPITVVQPERQTTLIQGRSISFASAVFNLLNAIAGSGVLGLAYIMKGSGVALFLALLVIMVFVVDYSLQLLLAAAITTKVEGEMVSYERLGYLAWGEKGRLFVSSMICIQNTGAMVSYFKVFKDVIHDIMVLMTDNSVLTNSDFMTCAAAFLVFIPACSTKIGVLAYVGVLAVGLTCFFVVFVFAKSFSLREDQTCQDDCDIKYFAPSVDTFLALPTLCFSFVCHTSLLPVYHELQLADSLGRTRRPQKRMMLAVHMALLLAFILYCTGAVFGYLTFRGNVNQNLLKSYQDTEPSAPLDVSVRLGFMVAVLCSIPLLSFPWRRSADHIYDAYRAIKGYEPAPEKTGRDFWITHILKTFVIILVMLVAALFVPHITTIFGAVGATSSVTLVFLLPASLYMKICLADDNMKTVNEMGSMIEGEVCI